MIDFTDVSKDFGPVNALKDVTFHIDKGEFVFLTGPSGAGKTTILRLLLGDVNPSAGKINFDGNDITNIKGNKLAHHRQKIGVVFQDFKLIPDKTVYENIETALAVVGVNHKEWDSRIERVLELTGMLDRMHFFPMQLSGGEAQRTALARALVINPEVLLADEPTGNLDWETASSIVGLMNKIAEEGKTIVFATHHQGIVDKMKKRTIKISGGKIVSDS